MGSHVLVVDDEPGIRSVLRIMLAMEGYEVEAAANGQEALERAVAHQPAVVLMDLDMPVMNGWQCIHSLQEQMPGVPVVTMTAAARARSEAVTLGAAGCLPKPFDVDTVLDTVARFIPNPQA